MLAHTGIVRKPANTLFCWGPDLTDEILQAPLNVWRDRCKEDALIEWHIPAVDVRERIEFLFRYWGIEFFLAGA